MPAINPYDLAPMRMNTSNANPFGTQSVMPQSNTPVTGTTTASFSTLQNVQETPTGATVNQFGQSLGVPPQGPQAGRGLLSSQMRSRTSPVAPAVQKQPSAMMPQQQQQTTY